MKRRYHSKLLRYADEIEKLAGKLSLQEIVVHLKGKYCLTVSRSAVLRFLKRRQNSQLQSIGGEPSFDRPQSSQPTQMCEESERGNAWEEIEEAKKRISKLASGQAEKKQSGGFTVLSEEQARRLMNEINNP